jgi:DNA-3-methyladenine glycosylase
MKRLLPTYSEAFFARPTVKVAPELIGVYLNRRLPNGTILRALISEVEAYTADDPASHAFKGETKRSQVMFGAPGRAYVYFIYGMYYCLNVVTEDVGVAGAVLIRGLLGEGLDGPGKICREWQIDQSLNGLNLLDPASVLWLSKPEGIARHEIAVSPRIGISKATDKLWRFYLKDESGKKRVSKAKGKLTARP